MKNDWYYLKFPQDFFKAAYQEHNSIISFIGTTNLNCCSRFIPYSWNIVALFSNQATNERLRNHHFRGHMFSCKSGCPKVDVVIRENILIWCSARWILHRAEWHWITWRQSRIWWICMSWANTVCWSYWNHFFGWIFPT